MINIKSITLALFFNVLLLNSNYLLAEVNSDAKACNSALSNGDALTAITLANKILAENPKHHTGLLCKARAQDAMGEYQPALKTFDAAIKVAEPGFDLMITHLLVGNLHKKNQQLEAALNSYQKSLSITETENNNQYKRINLNLIGEIYAANKDFNTALTNYQAGAKLAMNDNERADNYERVAGMHSALNQHDLAIEYQLKGMLMQKKAGTLDQYADANLALGHIYTKAADYTKAESTFTKLAQFSKENGSAYYEAKSYLGLAQAKAASGDKVGAGTLVSQAKTLATQTNDKALLLEIESSTK